VSLRVSEYERLSTSVTNRGRGRSVCQSFQLHQRPALSSSPRGLWVSPEDRRSLAPKGMKRESQLINYESYFSIQRIDRAFYVPRNRPGLVLFSRFLAPPSRANFSRLIICRPGKNTRSSGRLAALAERSARRDPAF